MKNQIIVVEHSVHKNKSVKKKKKTDDKGKQEVQKNKGCSSHPVPLLEQDNKEKGGNSFIAY